MKKYSLLALLLLVFFTFSCNKDSKEAAEPKPYQKDYKPDNATGPHFDEKNSTKVNWDQMPSELKNATLLETKNAVPNARLQYSYYSFMYGPFGGAGGGGFYMYPPSGSKIYAMAIRSGTLIDKLIVWYRKADGTIYSTSAGGNGGAYYLQYFSADEYIYYVAGRSGSFVNRLSIYTNKKSFTYGGTGGTPFYASVPSGHQILGFWGRAGAYLDAIGFYAYTI